jgi:predicted DNA-binding antitoxin AbrB/MazE fold protein
VLSAVNALRKNPGSPGLAAGLRALTAPPHRANLATARWPERVHRGTILVGTMSIRVAYKDGVFEPLEDATGVRPGQHYTVFSDEELDEIRETHRWLKAAEKSFEFWNNAADAVYDTL